MNNSPLTVTVASAIRDYNYRMLESGVPYDERSRRIRVLMAQHEGDADFIAALLAARDAQTFEAKHE